MRLAMRHLCRTGDLCENRVTVRFAIIVRVNEAHNLPFSSALPQGAVHVNTNEDLTSRGFADTRRRRCHIGISEQRELGNSIPGMRFLTLNPDLPTRLLLHPGSNLLDEQLSGVVDLKLQFHGELRIGILLPKVVVDDRHDVVEFQRLFPA